MLLSSRCSGSLPAAATGHAVVGYITAKSGRRLAFSLVVNGVGVIAGFDSVISVFQDEGTISAILWKTH